ncbi:disco-interacting protein 2 homolog C-like [Tachypleus tridentatus]|uniref:disco-interacting protein 2 homolog C-like n=1 Tax=Tachypleus tridentatus TaxID=6853 RepID=UPI003FD0ABA2
MAQDIDIASLPPDVRDKLAELELELSEGDITQKGYEKKKAKLLGPYLPTHAAAPPVVAGAASPSTRAKRRAQRRLTRHESRYHSEVRQEAVQQALAAMQNRGKPSVPMPSKRTSVMATSPSRERHPSVYKNINALIEVNMKGTMCSRKHIYVGLWAHSYSKSVTPPRVGRANITGVCNTDIHWLLLDGTGDCTGKYPSGTVQRCLEWRAALSQFDIVGSDDCSFSHQARRFFAWDWRLLRNILYNLIHHSLQVIRGANMANVPSGLPKNLEAGIQRYGSATFKAPVVTVLDTNGKISNPLTYGKLLSRTHKIAYNILNKAGPKGEFGIKPGDRVCSSSHCD